MSEHGSDYVLAGFLRFVQSDEPGVVAHIISKYAPAQATETDVPVFRLVNHDGSAVTVGDWERAHREMVSGASEAES